MYGCAFITQFLASKQSAMVFRGFDHFRLSCTFVCNIASESTAKPEMIKTPKYHGRLFRGEELSDECAAVHACQWNVRVFRRDLGSSEVCASSRSCPLNGVHPSELLRSGNR